jgi:DNA-binding Lrp family transcriptional regulator
VWVLGNPSAYASLLREAREPISIRELARKLGLRYKSTWFMVRVLELVNCLERSGSVVRAKNIDICTALLSRGEVSLPRASMVIALLSDMHVGRKTPSFNASVLRERFKKYLGALTRIMDNHGGELVVLGLGDYVDGASIYPRQEYEQEMDPNEQVDVAFDITRELFEVASRFYGVVGNHGRTSESEHGNYDYFYLLQVRAVMGDRASISKRHHEYFKLPSGELVLLSHPPPPRIYSYQGIPDYGIRRFVASHVSANRGLREAFFGHFHTPKVTYEIIPVYLNGSFLSDDEYSRMLGLRTPASQLVIAKSDTGSIVYVVEL